MDKETTVWYRANHALYKIEPLNVVRASEHFIWYTDNKGKQQRQARTSDYCTHCTTWKDAQQSLLDRVAERLIRLDRQISFYEGKIEEIKALKQEAEH